MAFVRSGVGSLVFDDCATVKNNYTVLFMSTESL